MSVVDDVDVLQDFEIAGSRTGAAELGGLAAVVAGGGCGASGCECECECECAGGHGHGNNETSPSPLGTVHSWDSHANYRHRLSASPDHSLFSGVIVYCDHTHLNSPTGIIRVLLVVSIFYANIFNFYIVHFTFSSCFFSLTFLLFLLNVLFSMYLFLIYSVLCYGKYINKIFPVYFLFLCFMLQYSAVNICLKNAHFLLKN